ncbi:hypothetical protein GGI64_004124 [Rhizobium leguminosarum]|uniref:Uncharacterized protein n=1 Tax=Rhizobium leguminosarum TaxID=384 RepID=A0A7Z0IZV3_RHILE|nr:hypothetical protein [Rhizobium leguminosarum]NYJ13043.1 hypothetical protein [Rhizobium leguminosarum]
MKGASVTVVLFGADTYERESPRMSLKEVMSSRMAYLPSNVHNVKDPSHGSDVQGRNPLEYWYIDHSRKKTSFAVLYKPYNWVRDDGYTNMPPWIKAAAKAAGR